MNMSKKPVVSVTMPVYNGRKLIDASIQSLLNQTFTDWECIIVNDGSTDGTGEYLSTIEDPRFRIETFEQNRGRAAAREKALQLASGEFLAMLDADDLYHPEKLERQVKAMREHPEVVLVSCSICSFGTHSNLIYKRPVTPGVYTFDGVCPPHASSMLRMNLAKQFHYNELLNYAEDVDFMTHFLTGQQFLMMSDVLYYYSEIDSVTKSKLIAYYKNGIIHGVSHIKEGVPLLLSNVIKLLAGKIIYPFININKILKKRGVPLSDVETNDFRSYVLKYINEI